MKTKFCWLIILSIYISKQSDAQDANTTLSNLTSPTKVNVHLLPSKDSLLNLGSDSKSWRNLFIKGKIYLADTPTIYSISNSDFFAGPNAGIKLKYFNGQRNTGIGANALYYGGYSNTAVGWQSLTTDSTGYYNTGVGALSLLYNESGNENTATGNGAMYKLINGNDNTAAGAFALQANFSGNYNVAMGAYALYNCYNSKSNTAVGYQSLYLSTTGFNNTALGYGSLYKCTGGFQNTSVGYNAGLNVTGGDDNTFIGTNSNCGSTGDLNNATALGYAATVTSSNHIRIGNTSVTSIGGQVGWTNFSDERIKTNIKRDVPGLAFINLLNPATYNFDLNKEEQILKIKDVAEQKGKYDIQKIKFTGFLAQEVEAAAKKINYDFSGVDAPANDKDVYGLRYADFVVPLVKAVQELSAKNDSLQNQNLTQQKINADLEQRIAKLEAMMNTLNQPAVNGQLSTASLSQNIPNPFSNSTTINYSFMQQFNSAKIIITNKNGNAVKQINLSANKGSVTVDALALVNGAYQYSLYVDEKLVETKQMIISK